MTRPSKAGLTNWKPSGHCHIGRTRSRWAHAIVNLNQGTRGYSWLVRGWGQEHDGWSRTIEQAKRDATAALRSLSCE